MVVFVGGDPGHVEEHNQTEVELTLKAPLLSPAFTGTPTLNGVVLTADGGTSGGSSIALDTDGVPYFTLNPVPGTGNGATLYTFSQAGTLVAGVGTFKVYNITGATLLILATSASVGTAPTGLPIIIDVLMNGTTSFAVPTDKPTIAIGTTMGLGGAAAAWTAGSYLTVDINQVGSTAAGADLTVQILAA